MKKKTLLKRDPQWYKDAIIYEVHVKTFCDKNGDGIGDFKGLTSKLDYLENLGVTAIWLLPFYPSPLRDDGYDTADYMDVNPQYGTLKDFKELLAEAHKRGIRVITELVLNHTSNEHQWFQAARKAPPGSPERDFYVWSDNSEKYKDARIIFTDFEASNWTWDSVAGAYYWHRFYSHQPDLNFDNPAVHKALFAVIDYWFGMGVDGLRLDAVPYLYEREETNCENLPETHQFLKKLRAHIDSKFEDKMLLAEANQWPEDAVDYFGKGDECHMAFHFPIMPRIYMSLQVEDSFPLIDILRSTPDIPENCQWATFLRNHDELTLEMVTDEERDRMYRYYAQDPKAKINVGIRRRLAPLLHNNRRKLELVNILLFTMPGTPVIYYGDEIGMGDNFYLGDRNGVRTPMQWSTDRNGGFSRANPQGLYLPPIIDPEYHFESVNVENQERNLFSLLWWMKGLISARKKNKALGRGDFRLINSSNSKVFSFVRTWNDEKILVVINLSKYAQLTEIEVDAFEGYIPIEVFSKNKFAALTKDRYSLTLGGHDYFLFTLEEGGQESISRKIPNIELSDDWSSLYFDSMKPLMEGKILPKYLKHSTEFIYETRTISNVKIVEQVHYSQEPLARLYVVEIHFSEGTNELLLLPVNLALSDQEKRNIPEYETYGIANVVLNGQEASFYESRKDSTFRDFLFDIIFSKKKIKGLAGDIQGYSGMLLKKFTSRGEDVRSRTYKNGQKDTSFVFADKFILKLFRRFKEGVNPSVELRQLLTEKAKFECVPDYVGKIEYRPNTNAPISTIGILSEFIERDDTAWSYTLSALGRFFDAVLERKEELSGFQIGVVPSLVDYKTLEMPELLRELIGGEFIENIRRLAVRTAQMHLALEHISDSKDYAPEEFSLLHQRSMFQALQTKVRKTFELLKNKKNVIDEDIMPLYQDILAREKEIMDIMKRITHDKIEATRIRVHGDYQLGRVFYTGDDFKILDMEGDPIHASRTRRFKQSAFRDVASMIRSFHYATLGALRWEHAYRNRDIKFLENWTVPWYSFVSGVFLFSYLEVARGASFIPRKSQQIDVLLEIFLLENAIDELAFDLERKPEAVVIGLQGIDDILGRIK